MVLMSDGDWHDWGNMEKLFGVVCGEIIEVPDEAVRSIGYATASLALMVYTLTL